MKQKLFLLLIALLAPIALKAQNCVPPEELEISNITSSSADLTFMSVGSETQWVIYLDGEALDTIETDTYTFTGLGSYTSHVAGVCSYCDGGILSTMSTLSFTTLCGDMELPYFENFDSYTVVGDSTRPNCWTRVVGFHPQSATASTLYPNFATYDDHGTVMNFNGRYAPENVSGTMKIATPRIPVALNNLEIIFDVLKNTLTVYLATDPEDPSTYVRVRECRSTIMNWTTYEVRTDTIAGAPSAPGYLVFCANYEPGYSAGDNPYLDNLSVLVLNNCNRPESVSVSNESPNGAEVSWTAVAGATNYRVSYSTVDNIATATHRDVLGSTRTQLTGLNHNTRYYVWVQTLCSETSISDPRATNFTTQLGCYPIENLRQVSGTSDGAAFQWKLGEDGNEPTGVIAILRDLTAGTETEGELATGINHHFFTGLDATHQYEALFGTVCNEDTATYVSAPITFRNCGETELSEIASQQSQYFPIYTGFRYSYCQMVYPASVFLDMDTIHGLALRRSTNSHGTVVRTLSIWMADTSESSFAAPVPVTGMRQVANNVSYTLGDQEWDTLMFTTPFVHASSENVIVVFDDNTGTEESTSNSPYWRYHATRDSSCYSVSRTTNLDPANPTFDHVKVAAVPDMRFVGPCHADGSCEAPLAAVSNAGSETATLAWVDGEGGQWVIEYCKSGAQTWTVAGTATASPYTLENLTAGTHYKVRIGVTCNGEVRYSAAIPFETTCDPVHLPFHFTQEEMLSVIPHGIGFTPCWSWHDFYRDENQGRGEVYGWTGSWWMLPAIAEPLNGAQVRTWAASSENAHICVGVASLSDGSDIEWIDTVDVPGGGALTSHNEYVASLERYTGSGNRVVLGVIVDDPSGTTVLRFFDFHVEPLESCRPVNDLTLDSATAHTLSISWTPGGDETAWAVYVDNQFDGMARNTPNYTIQGLDPYSTYMVSVRSACGDGDTSHAVVKNFLTGCEGESCTFTIIGYSRYEDGWNGAAISVILVDMDAMSLQVVGSFTMDDGTGLSKSFEVCEGMPIHLSWYPGMFDGDCWFDVVNENGQTIYHASSGAGLGNSFYTTEDFCAETLGIADAEGEMPLTLYPNPTSDKVTLGGLEKNATVSVVDFSGREVYRKSAKGESLTLQVGGFAKGAYFVRVVGENGSVIRKLIVK